RERVFRGCHKLALESPSRGAAAPGEIPVFVLELPVGWPIRAARRIDSLERPGGGTEVTGVAPDPGKRLRAAVTGFRVVVVPKAMVTTDSVTVAFCPCKGHRTQPGPGESSHEGISEALARPAPGAPLSLGDRRLRPRRDQPGGRGSQHRRVLFLP